MNVVQKEERPCAKGSSRSFDCEVSKLNVKGQETEAGQSKAGTLLRGTERKFEKPRMGQRKRLYCEVPKGNCTERGKAMCQRLES